MIFVKRFSSTEESSRRLGSVEAHKPARAADKVGLDVVIRELREVVARLNDRHHNRRVRWTDGEAKR